MKEKVFCAVLSIAIVTSGSLVTLAEAGLLVHFGVTPKVALVVSLYTGFLGWVVLAASLACTDKFWSWSDRIIKK